MASLPSVFTGGQSFSQSFDTIISLISLSKIQVPKEGRKSSVRARPENPLLGLLVLKMLYRLTCNILILFKLQIHLIHLFCFIFYTDKEHPPSLHPATLTAVIYMCTDLGSENEQEIL